MKKFRWLLGLIYLVSWSSAIQAAEGKWEQLSWQGETAWISVSGKWGAVVSEKRARLIFLGEWESGINLLYAPAPMSSRPYRGGHRFWLGPQKLWPDPSSTPKDWEWSSGKVRVEAGELTVEHPRTDPSFPQLTRSYRWEGEALILKAGWKDPQVVPRQAMHILQLRRDALVKAPLQKNEAWPKGFALLNTQGAEASKSPEDLMALPVKELESDLLVAAHGEELKLGFLPAPIQAKLGGILLTMKRGAVTGAEADFPEAGMVTQVYLGADKYQCDFLEIEQLSGMLTPDSTLGADFTVEIHLEKIADPAASKAVWPEPEVTSLPQEISADHSGIRYLGRFAGTGSSRRAAWSGSAVQTVFNGTGANVKMQGKNVRVLVRIDDKDMDVLRLKEGVSLYRLARGLPAGEHRLELIRISEPLFGDWSFEGLQLEERASLKIPPSKERRIEFIGDSITCGYGNEAPWQKSKFNALTENFHYGYAATASRMLGAECVALSWSGRCLLPEKNVESLPALFSRTLPNDAQSRWDFNQWQPQVVVVNLGTNDFYKLKPDEGIWAEHYRKFLKEIRGVYPDAHIIMAIGSMMDQATIDRIDSYNRKIAEEFKASGDPKIHTLGFKVQQFGNGLGGDWHPSIRTHELMAGELADKLKEVVGWDKL